MSNAFLKEKHVVKHYEQNEIVKVLQDLIHLVKFVNSEKKSINFWNFYICFEHQSYKFFISQFQDEARPSEVLSDQIKFASILSYGLLKELIYAFYNIRSRGLENLLRLVKEKRLLKFSEIFQLIIDILLKEDIIFEQTLQSYESQMSSQLERYWNNSYSFKNEEIFKLDFPIFKFISKIHLEVSKRMDHIDHLVKFVCQKLVFKQSLESLTLKFPRNVLTNVELSQFVEAIDALKHLKNLDLDFSDNNFDDRSAEYLFDKLKFRNFESFVVDLSETNITNKGYVSLLELVSTFGDGLRVLKLDLMNKSSPFPLKNDRLSAWLQEKPNLAVFHLNWAYLFISKQNVLELTSAIYSLKNLEELSITLYDVKIFDDCLEMIMSSFRNLGRLGSLSLNIARNFFSSKFIDILGERLQKVPRLRELELQIYGNRIHKEDIIILIEYMRLLHLEKLTISFLEFHNQLN